MSDLEPRISDSDIKRATRTFHGKTYKFKWRGLDVIVKKLLSPPELLSFYKDVLDLCSVGDDGSIVEPMLDLSFRIGVIKSYTNIELPKDINEINYILYETDLFDVVVSQINQSQISFLRSICIG